jgi:hypothetical protein
MAKHIAARWRDRAVPDTGQAIPEDVIRRMPRSTDTNRQSNTVRPDCRFAALKGSARALASVSSELPGQRQQVHHDRPDDPHLKSSVNDFVLCHVILRKIERHARFKPVIIGVIRKRRTVRMPLDHEPRGFHHLRRHRFGRHTGQKPSCAAFA